MRDDKDRRRPWWALWFHPRAVKFAVICVNTIGVLGSSLLTFLCWIWWRSDVPLNEGIPMAVAGLLGHLAMTYETGYKKIYLDGRRRFFYLVWLVPCVLSVVGFTGGLIYRGIV